MDDRCVIRYRRRSRIFHWMHALAFLVLLLTGLARFLHTSPSGGLWTAGIIHRVAAVLFVGLPLLYYFIWPKQAQEFIRGIFRFSKNDLQWFKAAPSYYFGGSEDKMPPQGKINTGQRFWELANFLAGIVLIITGIMLWLFKYLLPIEVYQWALTIHAVVFILVWVFFLLHLYLGVFHPVFRESLRSMLDGRISARYAQRHYQKWYSGDRDTSK